jgi:hypothetical protein
MVTQTWTIKGKTYTHDQLMELKSQGLDPRKDDIQMKFVTPQVIANEKKKEEEPEVPAEPAVVPAEEPAPIPEPAVEPVAEPVLEPAEGMTEEEEFAELTAKRG